MALKDLAYPLDDLRKELGIERLPDGRVVLPANFCLAALSNFIRLEVSENKEEAVVEALEDVEEILGVCGRGEEA